MKLTILIIGLLVIFSAMGIAVTDYQHDKTITDYLDKENKLEDELTQSIENFTELEGMYLELQTRNDELERLTEEQGWQMFVVTGYSANDCTQGTNSITASGFKTDCGLPIVASNCIPLYSIIEIKELGGFIVLDTGLGYWNVDHWEDENWIDILFPTKKEAISFGVQTLMAKVIK